MKIIFLLATSLLLTGTVLGQCEEFSFRPASLFADHMVLQRDIPVPVWGMATSGDTITVEFAGQHKSTATGADGRWRITLNSLAASAESRPMRLHSAANNQTVVLSDVLVGEVWLGNGQSNMEMPVGNAYRPDVYPGVQNFREEITNANHPQLRLFLVEHQPAAAPMRDVPSAGWQVCSPETAPRFSAVGYFFARDLQRQLNVPVGMISAAWSATFAEAWCSPDGLRTLPKFARRLEAFEARTARTNPAPEIRREDPAALFNGMIAPLIPYALRGVIWYQGENDVKSARDYRQLFPALIRGWRKDWGQGDFPFLFVQLAGYGGRPKKPVEDGWANLREAQALALAVTNTGMAVTIDIGDAKKIHPSNKQEVGRRLGLLARSIAYGEKIETGGPLYQSMHVDGDKIRLTFNHTAGGLVAGGGGSLTGFAIAGGDGQWQFAHAEIAGNEVIVSSPQIAHPTAVRYGWGNNPACNLFNQAGLPAAPFRTDQPAIP